MVPSAPDSAQESRLSIGARALKDLLDHFPVARGPKSDPQLVWSFSDDEVILRGLESSMDTSGTLRISFILVSMRSS
jgi:cell cycle checkpoint control protein RAD9A